jgi:hypothetical protein
MQRFSATDYVSEPPKSPDSLQNSLLAGNLPGERCDRHCVASQAFLRSARLPKSGENRPEIPAFRAFGFVSGLPVRPT